ncbi:MAG: TetR family transcriptional regulator [Micromonosporaceae bacterium]|nr:TetR family transcriptional regulator [Micromonosporaceae bacterium]
MSTANILAAARAFATGGYAAISMDDIAAEAGVTRLIIYRHFDSNRRRPRAPLHAWGTATEPSGIFLHSYRTLR